jgi:hypothetical protein
VVSPDTEVVLMMNAGTDEITMIDRPTRLPTYPFIVRRTSEGWRIVSIGVFPES